MERCLLVQCGIPVVCWGYLDGGRHEVRALWGVCLTCGEEGHDTRHPDFKIYVCMQCCALLQCHACVFCVGCCLRHTAFGIRLFPELTLSLRLAGHGVGAMRHCDDAYYAALDTSGS
jgi:hypothetical protein